VDDQPSYADGEPPYVGAQSPYADDPPGYADDQPPRVDDPRGYADIQLPCVAAEPSSLDDQPPYLDEPPLPKARRDARGSRIPLDDLDSPPVSRAVEESNRRLLRARDAMDRTYAQPLDVAALARIACVSPGHFIRTFRATFGETPHRYLQRRRVERSMSLLRESDRSVTDICLDVGYTSLGTFSRTFREVVGQSPLAYRRGSAPGPDAAPTCFTMAWARPSSLGEAGRPSGTVTSTPARTAVSEKPADRAAR